ncbi:hypothetical protein PHPALM_30435 [Phytophthora palmivora]|uniref:Uncharacterized protein n=1 Tax=Phytophthora palmivora TaxID=4796 RepID=A0A2P4X549_9STRA|nr:hypothetical protein PHPALM_30435 [Phytophthora palmivora]
MCSPSIFTTKQVCSYFFTPILDERDEPAEHFRCHCSIVRKQDVKTGYSNLCFHVLKQHPDYVTTLKSSGGSTQRRFYLSFSLCESPTADKYTYMKRICTETLLKYAVLVTKEVENAISMFIPRKFGIMIDGWSFHSEHYAAVFAVFEHDQHSEKVLLVLAPIVDDITSVVFLVGDNCSSTRGSRISATRWGSTYKMIDRYFELRDAMGTDDDDIVSVLPTHRQENRLRALLDLFRDFQSATMKLQEQDVTHLDVRYIFDALVEKHPVVDNYLAADATIVKDPAFEEACVLVLADKYEELTEDQRLMHPFETVPVAAATPTCSSRTQGFADQVLSARKKQRSAKKSSCCEEHAFSTPPGMLPMHLETILSLKLNRRFWNASTVTKVVNGQ